MKIGNPNEQILKWLWGLAWWSFVILILVIAAMVMVVALGAGDPKPWDRCSGKSDSTRGRGGKHLARNFFSGAAAW